jgi:anti-sigma-K factor RskA
MSGRTHEGSEEIQMLAAEYVIGALDDSTTADIRQRAENDPALDAAIAAWERRLAPMASVLAPLAPPPALWTRLEQAIEASGAVRDGGLRLVSSQPAVPTPDTPKAPATRPRRVWPWQVATAASLALAAGFAGFAMIPNPVPAPMQLTTASLLPVHEQAAKAEDAAPRAQMAVAAPPTSTIPGFFAAALPDGRLVVTALGPGSVPPGRDLQLWGLPRGARTPLALGLLPAGRGQIVLAPAPAPGTQLMVSLEPQGGSPSGIPSGPIVYSGTIGAAAP